MDLIAIVAMSALYMVCFFVGLKTGQNTAGKGISIPTVKSPVKAIRERQEAKEADMEKHRMDIIMRNIEAYDGTGRGQEDVPRG